MTVQAIFKAYMVGDNIVTPSISGYGSLSFPSCTLIYELSHGNGIYGQPLYGLATLVVENNAVQQIRLGDIFKTPEERARYIAQITEEDIKNADRFGKILDVKL